MQSDIWYRLMPADHPTITAFIDGGDGVDKVAVNGMTVADLKHAVIAANPTRLKDFGAVDLTVYAGDGTGMWRKVDPDDTLQADTLRKNMKEYRVVHPLPTVDQLEITMLRGFATRVASRCQQQDHVPFFKVDSKKHVFEFVKQLVGKHAPSPTFVKHSRTDDETPPSTPVSQSARSSESENQFEASVLARTFNPMKTKGKICTLEMEVQCVDCEGFFFHSFTGSVGDAIFQEHELIVEFKKDGAIGTRSFVQAFLEATAYVYGFPDATGRARVVAEGKKRIEPFTILLMSPSVTFEGIVTVPMDSVFPTIVWNERKDEFKAVLKIHRILREPEDGESGKDGTSTEGTMSDKKSEEGSKKTNPKREKQETGKKNEEAMGMTDSGNLDEVVVHVWNPVVWVKTVEHPT